MPIYLGSHNLTEQLEQPQETNIETFNLIEVDSIEIRNNDRLVFYGTIDAVVDGKAKTITNQIQLPIIAGDNIEFSVENNKLKISSQSSTQSVTYTSLTFRQLIGYMQQIYSQGKTIIGGYLTLSMDENEWNNATGIIGYKTNQNTTEPVISVSSISEILNLDSMGTFSINVYHNIDNQFTISGYTLMNEVKIINFFNNYSGETISFDMKIPYTANSYTATYSCQFSYDDSMIYRVTLIYG